MPNRREMQVLANRVAYVDNRPMNKSTLGILTSAPLLSLIVGIVWALSPPHADAQLRRIAIGSNPAGTNYYVVASGIAKLLQDETGIPSTVRPFSGSSVYMPMLQRGEIPLGINTQIDSLAAYTALEPYTAPMSNLRLISALMPLRDNLMVRGDSGITELEDLRGRRVVIAIRSNVALERWHWAILSTAGLGPDDIDIVSVASLPDGVRLLTEGRVDAAPIGLATALARQAEATIPGGIRFLGIGSDEAKLTDSVPGAQVDLFSPEMAAVGIFEPTRLGRFSSYLNTGAHLADDDAYLIVKTIHQQWESLRRDYALLSPVPADSIAPADSPHPYHPGAARYFREAGLWTDAHERNQVRALGGAAR